MVPFRAAFSRSRLALFVAALALLGAACHSNVPPAPKPAPPGNYSATIVTDMGNIDIQLFAQQAPIAVGNFIGLAEGTQPWKDPATGKLMRGVPLYNGVTFHRVIPGFMIQAGDPLGTGMGTPGYQFANEIAPDLQFDRPGRVGMANAGPGTNGSQFFITVAPYPSLNGNYTIFGQVTQGQDVANEISAVPRDAQDKPLTPIHIKTIQIHRG